MNKPKFNLDYVNGLANDIAQLVNRWYDMENTEENWEKFSKECDGMEAYYKRTAPEDIFAPLFIRAVYKGVEIMKREEDQNNDESR